jgi:acyl-CoA thioesterase FadM
MQYFAYSQKAFVYKYVVMLSDVDQFKHMSFANYLRLMFLATDALFVSLFSEEFLRKSRIQLTSSRMQFKKQTISGDNILIKINSTQEGQGKFSLLHTFAIEETGELVGLGKQSYQLMKASEIDALTELPKDMLNILGPIEVDEKYLLYKY